MHIRTESEELYLQLCDMDLLDVRQKLQAQIPIALFRLSDVTSGWKRLSLTCDEWSRFKAQCISVAWKKNALLCWFLEQCWFFYRNRSVVHCECSTCAWLLSLIFVVLILLMNALQNHLSTMFTVKNNTTQSVVSLSLFTIIPADAKMLQTYLI